MKFRGLKVLILLFLLSGFGLLGWSQQIEVSGSKPDYNLASTNVHKIIGNDGDHFYVVKFHNGQYYFERLDKDLNLMVEKPIKLFEGLISYQLETACFFYDDLYIFFSRRRFNNTVLYYQKIDKSNLYPSSEPKELTTIRFINGNYPDFHFALSRHEQKLLIACQIKPLWSKVQFNEYYVFDKGLSLICKRKDSFEFTGQGPRENKYVIDEEGNFSMLSLQKRQSILSLFSDVKNAYTIYRYTQNGKNFRAYPVIFRDKYIRGIKIIGGEQGELICAGLYSELFRPGVRGSFYFKIDPNNGDFYDNTLNEFDNDLLTRLKEIKEPIIEKEELISYIMTDLVLRENGKVIFIAEQFFEQTYNTYNNLLIICYDTDGIVYWTQVIEKNQDFNVRAIRNAEIEPAAYREYVLETGSLDQYIENYCSYALMAPITGSSIILFYNDDIRNIDNPAKKRNLVRPRKSYIMAVIIDEYGNVSNAPVLKWKRRAMYPEPVRYYDTRYNTIVIPAFKGNKYNYYKITASF